MRKVKTQLQFRVPSWNFCTLDDFTANGRFSKETCRFCEKTKTGHRCLLFDKTLAADENFVYKTPACINMTAGDAVTIDEPTREAIDPKLIIRETLNSYKKSVSDLKKQGYPQALAETIATKLALGEK